MRILAALSRLLLKPKKDSEYVSLMKEEGFYQEKEPIPFSRVLTKYLITVMIITAFGFMTLDYFDGKWSEPEEALVVQKHVSKFGTHDSRIVRVETRPHLTWKDRSTYYIRAESMEENWKCPMHNTVKIKSYQGGVTGIRYSVKLCV